MLEYGMRLGLAADMQYDKRIADLRYNEEADRRAKSEAEAKAKMYADDFETANVMNSFDSPLVKQQAQAEIQKIGSWVNANRGWETSIAKRMEYKTMINNLKNNKQANQGLSSDAQIKRMSEYEADGKNAAIVSSKEYEIIAQQKKNYLAWGNQDATDEASLAKLGGQKSFQFRPPEDAVSTADAIKTFAAAAEYDTYKNFGIDGMESTVSSIRKRDAANHLLADSHWGKYLKKDYDKYQAQLIDNEKSKAMTINEFTVDRMEPYFKAKKRDAGHAPSNSGGGGKNNLPAPSVYKSDLDQIKAYKGKKGQMNANALNQHFQNEFNQMQLIDVVNPITKRPVNLGTVKASSTGLVSITQVPDKNSPTRYRDEASQTVTVYQTIEDFYDSDPANKQAISEGFFGTISPGGPANNSTSWKINSDYSKTFKKEEIDGKSYVVYNVEQKFDPSYVSIASVYNQVAGHAKAEDQDSYQGMPSDEQRGQEKTYTSEDHPGQLFVLRNGKSVRVK